MLRDSNTAIIDDLSVIKSDLIDLKIDVKTVIQKIYEDHKLMKNINDTSGKIFSVYALLHARTVPSLNAI